LTQSQPPITRTTHTLPFGKLSPRDFEQLCLWLVEREGYLSCRELTEEKIGVMENTDAQDSQINPLILPIRVLTPPTSPTTPRRI